MLSPNEQKALAALESMPSRSAADEELYQELKAQGTPAAAPADVMSKEQKALAALEAMPSRSKEDEELYQELKSAYAPPPEPTGKLESFARGAISGLTWGAAPKIAGLVEGALTDKTVEQATAESEKEFADAEKDNKGIFKVASAGGNIASGVALTAGVGLAAGAAARSALGVAAGGALAKGAKYVGGTAVGKKAVDMAGSVSDAVSRSNIGGAIAQDAVLTAATGSPQYYNTLYAAGGVLTGTLKDRKVKKGLADIAEKSGVPLETVQQRAADILNTNPKAKSADVLTRVKTAFEAAPSKLPVRQRTAAATMAESKGIPLAEAESIVAGYAAGKKQTSANRLINEIESAPVQGPALPTKAESLASKMSGEFGTNVDRANDYLTKKASAAQEAKTAAVGRIDRLADKAQLPKEEVEAGLGLVKKSADERKLGKDARAVRSALGYDAPAADPDGLMTAVNAVAANPSLGTKQGAAATVQSAVSKSAGVIYPPSTGVGFSEANIMKQIDTLIDQGFTRREATEMAYKNAYDVREKLQNEIAVKKAKKDKKK